MSEVNTDFETPAIEAIFDVHVHIFGPAGFDETSMRRLVRNYLLGLPTLTGGPHQDLVGSAKVKAVWPDPDLSQS